MNLWLDDVRLPPDGYIWVKTAREALVHLASGTVVHASLDHDLGYQVKPIGKDGLVVADFYDHTEVTGSDLAMAICFCRCYPTKSLTVHSWNPSGGRSMIAIFEAAKLKHGATFELYYRPFATP